ncbi:MAG: bifunctional glycosyltransferase family 2/GtrA family protein [Oscillospiraceae bacterium]
MEICAIVPSYNPDEKLINVVDGLKKNFAKVIVVDDGSAEKSIFDRISGECEVLHHCKNLGKGRAMKTALNHYINNYFDECEGVVFVDGDGQHSLDDVCKCAAEVLNSANSMVLGIRNFQGKDVPKSNKAGNKITSFVFRMLCGIDISDTQTGLRALPNGILLSFVDVFGERFEYETEMLLETKALRIPIKEIPIKTVYIDENRTSHFNHVTDSWRIYKVILKFIWSSIASTVIDFLLYLVTVLAFGFLGNALAILIATVVSRVTSSLFNFTMNKNLVFKSLTPATSAMPKYYILCVVQMIASYAGVYGLTTLFNTSSLIFKILVDFVLFFVSFQIQREWVFSGKGERKKGEKKD